MESSNPFAVKLVSHVGWVLTVLGGIFAVWVFFLIVSAEKGQHPLMILFFFIFIFCSVAIGQFFVVLNVIVTKLQNIETNSAEAKLAIDSLKNELGRDRNG
ncbi:MAG: hypothetical protein M0R77_21330 [Gammaproteobacteria bacterium]|nr:hypothetical protein [Gammaproteobacteria bacterium]